MADLILIPYHTVQSVVVTSPSAQSAALSAAYPGRVFDVNYPVTGAEITWLASALQRPAGATR